MQVLRSLRWIGFCVFVMGLAPGVASASPMLISSVTRSVSLEIVEIPTMGPSNGGVGPLFAESLTTGAFDAGFPTSYTMGDGSTIDVHPRQTSFVDATRIDFDADTRVGYTSASSSPNDLYVDAHAYLEVVFSLTSSESFDLIFTPDVACIEYCTRFSLEYLDVGSVVFEGNGTAFNGSDYFGTTAFSGVLAAGDYRFVATSDAYWGISVHDAPGGPLAVAFAVPEPGTFVLLGLGCGALAVTRRRVARSRLR